MSSGCEDAGHDDLLGKEVEEGGDKVFTLIALLMDFNHRYWKILLCVTGNLMERAMGVLSQPTYLSIQDSEADSK